MVLVVGCVVETVGTVGSVGTVTEGAVGTVVDGSTVDVVGITTEGAVPEGSSGAVVVTPGVDDGMVGAVVVGFVGLASSAGSRTITGKANIKTTASSKLQEAIKKRLVIKIIL